MTSAFDHIFFDIGGVLGSNGWDHEQRAAAAAHFDLDTADFQYRHEETVGALESGTISLDEYLDLTVFCEHRPFTREAFRAFMFAQSVPFPDSIAVVRDLRAHTAAQLMTLNNESRDLNVHRIQAFGLCALFSAFFTSCWLGVRKPTREIYEKVLGITQAEPRRCLFVDDREQNLGPARALGMSTIRFESAAQLRVALVTHDLL
jgi:putative hydrolase of the HAD superfamily